MDRIEKYRIVEEIGQGGMSIVYRGHDESLDRPVAVKVMHKHLARDPDSRERFRREAQAVAKLTHRNIPKIYEYSSDDSNLNYLVTELVDGASLAELVREGPPIMPEIGAMIVVGVADALSHAHLHGIIHRDVKPENILLGRDGVVKLTDFGIAQIVGLESMTITGTLVGSPAHMSPEQIEGRQALDFRSDLWSLGTVLYVVATGGALPFEATTPHGVLKRIVEGRFEDPRRLSPHVGSNLAAIIDRCLQVDREARYASVELLAADLRAWLAGLDIGDIEAELSAWMADREAYQDELGARLTITLMRIADEELAGGRRHSALEAYGRVLTLDPDHPEASTRIRTLTSGLRLRRWVRRAGMLAVAILLGATAGWGIWRAVDEGPPWTRGSALESERLSVVVPRPADAESPKPVVDAQPETRESTAPMATNAGRLTGVVLGTEAKRVVASAAGATVQINPRHVAEGTHPVPIKPIRFRITVEPPAVSLEVDGKPARPGTFLQLRPGKHEAVLTHPACPECGATRSGFEVSARAGASRSLHLRFRFKPAYVMVQCPAGTVSVDGTEVGSCGKKHEVPVMSPKPRSATVRVVLQDGTVRERPMNLKPGAMFRWSLP